MTPSVRISPRPTAAEAEAIRRALAQLGFIPPVRRGGGGTSHSGP
ncbi:MAG TPA: hypothetical protein VFQ71_14120 [Gaiellales bacterium]|nr:hypothetical protein [Gaiellales bacterium]